MGKCKPGHGAEIAYGNEAIVIKQYEVLLGDSQGVRWVPHRGRFDPNSLGARPVEGGREADGTPLYIAQAHVNNGIHPGKCSEKLSRAFPVWPVYRFGDLPRAFPVQMPSSPSAAARRRSR